MLHDPREQTVEIEADRLAVQRPRIDDDLLRPPYIHPQAGQAQAALLLHRGATGTAEHRIDEDEFLAVAPPAGRVHDEETIGEGDLIGGEPDPFSFIHDVEHLPDGFADRLVDPHQRFRGPQQCRVGIFDEGERADGARRNLGTVWHGRDGRGGGNDERQPRAFPCIIRRRECFAPGRGFCRSSGTLSMPSVRP